MSWKEKDKKYSKAKNQWYVSRKSNSAYILALQPPGEPDFIYPGHRAEETGDKWSCSRQV